MYGAIGLGLFLWWGKRAKDKAVATQASKEVETAQASVATQASKEVETAQASGAYFTYPY